MIRLGFELVQTDRGRTITRTGKRLIRPASRKYQTPGEVCFVYEHHHPMQKPGPVNDYRVFVWPTKRYSGWVNHDQGWVIIANGAGRRVYSSYPFNRRGDKFLLNLFNHAQEALKRVAGRPLCCGVPMEIRGRRDRLKSRFWQCAVVQGSPEHRRRFDDIEVAFTLEEKERIKKRRKRRANQRKRTRAKGKEPYAAFKSRMKHPWIAEDDAGEAQKLLPLSH